MVVFEPPFAATLALEEHIEDSMLQCFARAPLKPDMQPS